MSADPGLGRDDRHHQNCIRKNVCGPTRRIARRNHLSIILLIGISLFAVFAADVQRTSIWTTFDEPTHLLAAQKLRSGLGLDINFEHPVGTKLLAAAGLRAAPAPTLIEQTYAGRRGFPWFFGLLVFSAGLLTMKLSGRIPGLAVSFLLLLDSLFGILPAPLAAYVAGMEIVDAEAAPGLRFNYLFGRLSPSGFRSYFTVALFVKLLAATVVLLVLALPLALFAMRPGFGAGPRLLSDIHAALTGC